MTTPTPEEIVAEITARASAVFEAASPNRDDIRDSFLVGWISGELIDAIRILQTSKSPEAKQYIKNLSTTKS